MLSTLAGSTLGVWVSHGGGKFNLPMGEDKYNIVLNMVMKAIRQTRMVLISTQPCYVTLQVVIYDDATH
jgi:hypothetical protein